MGLGPCQESKVEPAQDKQGRPKLVRESKKYEAPLLLIPVETVRDKLSVLGRIGYQGS